MDLGHLFTRSGLTRLEVSVMVSAGFFHLLVCTYLIIPRIYYKALCLHVATSFFCTYVFCPKLSLCKLLLVLVQLYFPLWPTLILSSHVRVGFYQRLFLSSVPARNVRITFLPHSCFALRSSYTDWFITRITRIEQHKSRSSSLCNFVRCHFVFSILDPISSSAP
jgi:hypothetical protein